MKTETWLPLFPGFYGTILEPDETDEMYSINNERENKGLTELDYDQFDFDFEGYNNEVAKAFTHLVFLELNELNLVKKATFQNTYSPKEYNFSNDSVNVIFEITEENKGAILKHITSNRSSFDEYIKRKHTSGPGFHSFHSNDPEEWIEKLDEFLEDSYKCGAILEACLNIVIDNEYHYQDDMLQEICERLEVYICVENRDQVDNLEYCNECCEWVDPSNFNGNCCTECMEFDIQNLDKIVCTHCRDIITNKWEARQLTWALKHHELKADEVLCSDCACVLK